MSFSVPTFKYSASMNLTEYGKYIDKVTERAKELQKNLKTIANEVCSFVLVDGKWTDDNATKFAKWWNEGTGINGVDCLARISKEIEELYDATITKVCESIVSNKNTAETHKSVPVIAKAKNNVYDMIEKIRQSNLSQVAIKAIDPSKVVADAKSINPAIQNIINKLNEIQYETEEIRHYVAWYLTDKGRTAVIELDDLSYSGVKNKVEIINNQLETVKSELLKQLNASSVDNNEDWDKLSKILNVSYVGNAE